MKCQICNYISTDKSNYARHCKSKRHHIKVEEVKKNQVQLLDEHKRTCKLCNKIFSKKSNLVRHNNKYHTIAIRAHNSKNIQKVHKVMNSIALVELPPVSPKSDLQCRYCAITLSKLSNKVRHEGKCSERKMQELEQKYKDREELYKERYIEKDKQIDMLLEDKRNLMELSIQNSKNSSKALSALGYIVCNYTDTKALEHIDDTTLKQIVYNKDQTTMHIAKIFMMYYSAKSLHKHIGEAIVKAYKEEDPSDQSFHTTDVSRLNYVVMTAIGTKREWIQDKGGIKISDKIIDPIMEKISELVEEFIDNVKNDKEIISFSEQRTIFGIKDDIDDGKLQKQIHKFIAPYFKTGVNSLVEN
jgi:hypothetical protein